MDMATTFPDQVLFHMTGRRTGDGLLPVDGLRPAALAPYRELDRLRHDFPLVLDDAGGLAPLSDLVDRALVKVAPRGPDGELLRRHVLRVEQLLRDRVSQGDAGTLSLAWRSAAEAVAGGDPAAQAALAMAGAALDMDGEIAGCDAALPERALRHLWQGQQRARAERFLARVDALVRRLADIERAAWLHSRAGRAPQALQASVGAAHADVFDFDAMSAIVARGAPADELPPARRARIAWALGVLRAQPFHADPKNPERPVHRYAFDDCASAMDAHRARLPGVVEMVKAMAVAELEARGAYVEARHDALFERFGERSITAGDLAQFPDYLVCIPPQRNDAPENAGLLEMLSSGLPVKVLVQLGDLLEEDSIGVGHFAFGVRNARLATTAMGLGGMFVLQSAASNLPALRERVAQGLRTQGPALFCVFAGAPGDTTDQPPYLSAAAAMESRAFPAFTYDAAAGANWATRFSLENNRDPEADWPVDRMTYADESLQRCSEVVAFTYADFVLTDRRHAQHFAAVPRQRWGVGMVPAADWLALPDADAAERVPYVLAVDAQDRLVRVIVDGALMHATRRCLLLWHRLQEHGGVHNSHAEQLLARERAAWESKKQALEAQPSVPTASPAPAAPEAAAEPDVAAPPPSDEAWIETARCPSCNECQLINDRLFVYDENKQAHIGDLKAGTFRQMVEAAESCQVAIIHPGKPWNPDEPGLEELLERAKPFL